MPDTDLSGEIRAAVTAADGATPSPRSEPSDIPTPASTVPADGTETRVATDDKRGPIPLDRHEAILRTQRREFEQQLAEVAWAHGHKAEDVARWRAVADAIDRDPQGVIAWLTEQGHRTAVPAPNLQAEDGTPLYDATQAAALVDYKVQQALDAYERKLDARFGPLEERTRHADAYERAGQQLDEAQQWPGFRDHVEAITDCVADARAKGHHMTLADAYIRVVVPVLADTMRTNVLKQMQTTSLDAADTINPKRQPMASAISDDQKTLADDLREELQRRRMVA